MGYKSSKVLYLIVKWVAHANHKSSKTGPSTHKVGIATYFGNSTGIQKNAFAKAIEKMLTTV